MEHNNIASGMPKQNFYSNFLSFRWVKKSVAIEVISSLLILLFVYAALSKLRDYETFKSQLVKSPYISNMADFIAWSIPSGELTISILLAFKQTRLIGLYSSFFLMLVFTGYIYAMLHFSYFVPCSCGGVLSQMSWNQHFIFNIAFSVLSLLGIILTLKGNPPKAR
jgi:hypothetical protein